MLTLRLDKTRLYNLALPKNS